MQSHYLQGNSHSGYVSFPQSWFVVQHPYHIPQASQLAQWCTGFPGRKIPKKDNWPQLQSLPHSVD